MPVLALHGTPGSALKFANADQVASNHGLRLICPDRWGYGGSTCPADPALPAFADDVCHLFDALGIGRFAVLGVSGGGPYAVATAALLGARIIRLALAGPAGDVRDMQDVSFVHRLCFRHLAYRPGLVRLGFRAYRALLEVAPGLALSIAVANAPAADGAIVRDPAVRAGLIAAFRSGLQAGVDGPVCDMTIFGRGLGDLPERVAAECRVWMGSLDGNVPVTAVRRLAERLPRARLVVREGDGHFWIMCDYEEVFGWLATGANRT